MPAAHVAICSLHGKETPESTRMSLPFIYRREIPLMCPRHCSPELGPTKMMRFSSGRWGAQMGAACSAVELTHQGSHTLDQGCATPKAIPNLDARVPIHVRAMHLMAAKMNHDD